MFFVGLFGITSKDRLLRDSDIECKECGSAAPKKVIKRYHTFHIFFIPTVRWNLNYFCVCPSCKSVFELKKEKGLLYEENPTEELTYWDLKTVKKGKPVRICKSCGVEVDRQYQYCPKCGAKQE
jgi:Zn finger protein HypA/HybF involved in hydrogenase expression